MMYVVFIVDNIHHLTNESNILIFAYICDWKVYVSNHESHFKEEKKNVTKYISN